MVINILVHIKGLENVKRVAEVNLPGDSDISTKDREKVSGADDGVNVHNGHDPILVAVEIGLNNPYVIVRVGVVEGFAELVDKCA